MGERYVRLFSLPENLYSEGSPVLILAGALLKDNHTGKVLVQLKFRNISQKTIKSVKIKVNAYDSAKEPLNGQESFSYLDLDVAENGEFGQGTPIHLPDVTTRSFSVEILSAVYADNEVFSPITLSIVRAAPKEVLEKVQRAEMEKLAQEEAAKIEARQKAEMVINKQCKSILLCACISFVLLLLSLVCIWGSASYYGVSLGAVFRGYAKGYLIALIAPCACLIGGLGGKKNPIVLKTAAIICVVLFAVQIASAILCDYIMITFGFNKLGIWVIGSRFLGQLLHYRWEAILNGASVTDVGSALLSFAHSFFAVIASALPSIMLVIYSKKTNRLLAQD